MSGEIVREIAAELASAARQLRSSGVEAARFDAEVLLADVLGFDRGRLFVERTRVLDLAERERFAALVARRARREPLQQLRGRQEFYSRDFLVDGSVLCPRQETETLVEAVIESTKSFARPRILDVGTGSGVIAVTLALEVPAARVCATDVSDAALAVARRNAEALGAIVDFRRGDVFGPFAGERFDRIVSNPPYIASGEIAKLEPEVRDHEPRIALDGGSDGLDFYRRLAVEAPALLAEEGELAVEVGDRQSLAVAAILADAELVVIETRRDLFGVERVVRARRG